MSRTLQERAQGEIEASNEWHRFVTAIQTPQPATVTFTDEALMLIHLMLGDKAIRHES